MSPLLASLRRLTPAQRSVRYEDPETGTGLEGSLGSFKYHDFANKEYQKAVGNALDVQRDSLYSRLNDWRNGKLKKFVVGWSQAFYIDGAAPSRIGPRARSLCFED